jgi:hypothetical protein
MNKEKFTKSIIRNLNLFLFFFKNLVPFLIFQVFLLHSLLSLSPYAPTRTLQLKPLILPRQHPISNAPSQSYHPTQLFYHS